MLRDDDNGRRRELEVVTIDDLQVDHRYQRDLNQTFVELILADYDPVAADVLTISRREDGSEWIVNGQHHAAAARLAGETEALAWVYEGLSVMQEADLRLKANHRKSDTHLDRFHAAFEAGRENAVQIVRLTEEFGTRVNRSGNSHTGINAASALEAVYKVDEGLLLRRTLKFLRDTYGQIGGDNAQEAMIRGVSWFILQHSTEASMVDVRDRLEKAGVEEIVRKARTTKAAMGGSLWINVYRAMVEIYNYRRSMQHRIEWRTKRSTNILQPDRGREVGRR
jgi:hypothetical protein